MPLAVFTQWSSNEMGHVTFPQRLSRLFYKKSRIAFPNEEYAILLGTEEESGFSIEDLYFPPERLLHASPDRVIRHFTWFEAAQKIADLQGLEVLGDIHSHCYDFAECDDIGPYPSEQDWDGGQILRNLTLGEYRLIGIVRVLKKGDRMACRSRFWPAIDLPITVK